MSNSREMTIGDKTFEIPVEDNQEQAISEGYKKLFEELVYDKGFSPRKARRYLESISKKKVQKFSKQAKARQATGTIKYIDNETN